MKLCGTGRWSSASGEFSGGRPETHFPDYEFSGAG